MNTAAGPIWLSIRAVIAVCSPVAIRSNDKLGLRGPKKLAKCRTSLNTSDGKSRTSRCRSKIGRLTPHTVTSYHTSA
jgi:hypothetical protein